MGDLARAVLGMRKPKKQAAEAHTVDKARQIVDINDLTYFRELLKQLEKVAQMPVNVGQHASMIEQVGKQNAYREILDILRKDLETAERILAGHQARQRAS